MWASDFRNVQMRARLFDYVFLCDLYAGAGWLPAGAGDRRVEHRLNISGVPFDSSTRPIRRRWVMYLRVCVPMCLSTFYTTCGISPGFCLCVLHMWWLFHNHATARGCRSGCGIRGNIGGVQSIRQSFSHIRRPLAQTTVGALAAPAWRRATFCIRVRAGVCRCCLSFLPLCFSHVYEYFLACN
eukprot:COSAG05_NODE_328_length_11337_cov_252.011805_3_plen_184_part_00